MLDVHILNYQPNEEYWQQCISSVEKAIENANYPIELYVTNGDSNFAKARADGYALGNNPYVTHIDNDDYIFPNAFSILKPALEASADAIFTGELRLVEKNLFPLYNNIFHLNVYNRKILINHRNYGYKCDLEQRRIANKCKYIKIPNFVYVWRQHSSPYSKIKNNLTQC